MKCYRIKSKTQPNHPMTFYFREIQNQEYESSEDEQPAQPENQGA